MATLTEVSGLVTPAIKPAYFRSEQGVAREEGMAHRTMPAPAYGRQLNLEFEPRGLEGLDDAERRKAVSTLAQILMQAAGLMVEELSDDRH